MPLHEFESNRLRGLIGRPSLPPDEALLIRRCRSVHTVGMRFAIDLVWLDADGLPLRVDRAVPPLRVRTCLQARAVLECAAGSGARFAAARVPPFPLSGPASPTFPS
jgi:uncharacterized membrane protein (UPF0127 family)